jgi:hypothetical protein
MKRHRKAEKERIRMIKEISCLARDEAQERRVQKLQSGAINDIVYAISHDIIIYRNYTTPRYGVFDLIADDGLALRNIKTIRAKHRIEIQFKILSSLLEPCID